MACTSIQRLPKRCRARFLDRRGVSTPANERYEQSDHRRRYDEFDALQEPVHAFVIKIVGKVRPIDMDHNFHVNHIGTGTARL